MQRGFARALPVAAWCAIIPPAGLVSIGWMRHCDDRMSGTLAILAVGGATLVYALHGCWRQTPRLHVLATGYAIGVAMDVFVVLCCYARLL